MVGRGTAKSVTTVRVLKRWHFKDLNVTRKDRKQKEELNTSKRPLSQNFVVLKRCSPDEVKHPCDENIHFNIKEVVNVKMEICRVCIKQGTVPIHGNDPSDDLAGAVSTFGGIDISIFDSYPKYLCESCHALLQGAMLFRHTAQSSDQLLKKSAVQVPTANTSISEYISNEKQEGCLTSQIESDILFDNPMEPESEVDDLIHDSVATEDPSIPEPPVYLNTSRDIINYFKKPPEPKTNASTCKLAIDDNDVCSLFRNQIDLTCKKCNIQYDSFQDYKEHKLKTRKHNMKMCTACGKTYAVWFTKKYNQTIQKVQSMYMCENCYGDTNNVYNKLNKLTLEKTDYFSNNFALEHVDKALEAQKVVVTCKSCEIEFDKFEDYTEHMLHTLRHKTKMCTVCKETNAARYIRKCSVSIDTKGIYVCDVCYKKDLNTLVQELTDIEKPPSTFMVHKVKLKCKQCNLSFSTFPEYKLHKGTHKQVRKTCPICSQSYTVTTLKKHLQIHKRGGAAYVCDICGKHLAYRRSLIKHIGTHFNNFPYKCSLCAHRTRLSDSLRIHMRTHTGETPYLCEECPKKFQTKSNLIKHRYTHKKEYEFQCECGRGFHTKKQLGVHIKVVHVGLKEHVCQICGKAYGYRNMMMRHQIRVHKREKLKGKPAKYLRIESIKKQDNYTPSTEHSSISTPSLIDLE